MPSPEEPHTAVGLPEATRALVVSPSNVRTVVGSSLARGRASFSDGEVAPFGSANTIRDADSFPRPGPKRMLPMPAGADTADATVAGRAMASATGSASAA
jgi:hypothetical protein